VGNRYKILFATSEGKKSLRRPRSRWEDNIRMGLMEVGWKVVIWIYVPQDWSQCQTLVKNVTNL
jgi:hypothetical protein